MTEGSRKVSAEQPDHAPHRRLVELVAVPQRVADPGGVGVEPDIPGERRIAQFGERLDRDLDAEQMRDPAPHRLGQRGEPGAAAGEIERHVEAVAALPIAVGVVVVENVDLGFGRNAEHRHQRRHRRRYCAADGFLVGGDQRAFVQGDALRCGRTVRRRAARAHRHAVERVAQDHVHELIDEQRRRLAEAVAHQIEIGRFQRLVAQQMIAKGDQHLPVLARVGVGDRRDLGRRNRQARIGQQRGMQRALDRAGLRRRHQLRPRQIDLEEFVGDDEPAAVVAVEQMMAAGEPEVVHLRSRSAMPIRSTASPGCSSSPSTSRNENARAGFWPLRGRSVRNASRTSPSSNVRCTAISVSCG